MLRLLPVLLSSRRLTAGSGQPFRDVPVPALSYCPPLSLSFGAELSCAAESRMPSDNPNLYIAARVEEAEWAVASAREGGRLSAEVAGELLAFLEGVSLVACLWRYSCALSGVDFLQEADEKIAQVMRFFPGVLLGSLDFDKRWEGLETGDHLILFLEALQAFVAESGASEEPGYAWYPSEVSPACQVVAQQMHRELRPSMWLQGVSGEHVVATENSPMPEVLARVGAVADSDSFVVNLGANNGQCTQRGAVVDAANCAFDLGMAGFAVEGQDGHLLEGRWEKVQVHAGYVSPWNVSKLVVESLSRQGIAEVDLLKIDLDHADCTFAQQMLRVLPRPKVLHVEYNRDFPPPIRYWEHFSERVVGEFLLANDSFQVLRRQLHWAGCSMQAWMDLAAEHGYTFLQADFQDITFVRDDLAGRVGAAQPEDLFSAWCAAAYCRAPARRMHGHQVYTALDLRALAEAGSGRCRLAAAWWAHAGAHRFSDLWC